MVIVYGNWFPKEEKLVVKRLNPSIAKVHHGVLWSLQVDMEVITSAFKAQLPYTGLLRHEGRRVFLA